MKLLELRHFAAPRPSVVNGRLALAAAMICLLCSSSWGSTARAQNLAWAPQQRINGVGSSNGPSIAFFGGRLFAAWKGVHDDQGIYWSSFNGGAWAPQQKINGVGSSHGPSLAVFGNRLFAAWKGVHDDQGIYWSSFNGAGWAPQQKINGVGTSNGPSLAVFQNRLFAAWKGIHDDQGIYWSSASPAAAAPVTCAHCNDGSCQCGPQTGPQLCSSHGGHDPSIGCIQQQ